MGLKLSTFEHVYKERMQDNTTNTKSQSKRLKLRNSVYSKLSMRYCDEEGKDNQMVRLFYNLDVPLDANRNLLSSILYTIKSLRNSVASKKRCTCDLRKNYTAKCYPEDNCLSLPQYLIVS